MFSQGPTHCAAEVLLVITCSDQGDTATAQERLCHLLVDHGDLPIVVLSPP
jgi:hypothetical protein